MSRLSPKLRAISIIFLFCAALEVWVCFRFQGPTPVPGSAAVSGSSGETLRFSAVRAMDVQRHVFPDVPHPVGSAENAEVRRRIIERLEADGWAVESADQALSNSAPPEVASAHGNIIAYRPEQSGLETTPLVLASHFDSCQWGPGAGDAAACVAAVIEVGRLLTTDITTLQRPLWILLTDGEEAGLVGAKQFVSTHAISAQEPFVLNLDARGNAGPVVMFETHSGNLSMIRHLSNRMVRPKLTGSLYNMVYRMLPNGTDFTEFRNAGWRGFNLALIDGAHHYHQPTDTLANLDARSVQHFGETALSLAREIAESRDEFRDTSEDAIFFDVLGVYVITMPLSWNTPLRFVILFAAVQVYGRRLMRTRQFGSVFRVWFTMAVILPTACVAGWLVSRSLFGTSLLPRPFVAHGPLLTLVMWIFCLALMTFLVNGLLRKVPREVLWPAFWLAHAATCMVVSIYLPELSYLLSVPALLALVATPLIADVLHRTAIVSCLSAILLIPLHHLMAIALGPANGALLFPAFSLLIMPMLPAFGRGSGTASDSVGVQRETAIA